MKHLLKPLCLFFAIALLLGLCACGGKTVADAKSFVSCLEKEDGYAQDYLQQLQAATDSASALLLSELENMGCESYWKGGILALPSAVISFMSFSTAAEAEAYLADWKDDCETELSAATGAEAGSMQTTDGDWQRFIYDLDDVQVYYNGSSYDVYAVCIQNDEAIITIRLQAYGADLTSADKSAVNSLIMSLGY